MRRAGVKKHAWLILWPTYTCAPIVKWLDRDECVRAEGVGDWRGLTPPHVHMLSLRSNRGRNGQNVVHTINDRKANQSQLTRIDYFLGSPSQIWCHAHRWTTDQTICIPCMYQRCDPRGYRVGLMVPASIPGCPTWDIFVANLRPLYRLCNSLVFLCEFSERQAIMCRRTNRVSHRTRRVFV